MRKITQADLAPLADLLRAEALTVEEIEARCAVSRETAYRYLRAIHTPAREFLARVRRPDGAKAWRIVAA